MMQIFALTVERTLRRKLHIAARDADHARQIAAQTLPAGQRIIAASAVNTETLAGLPAADLGFEALDHLLQRCWMPLDGKADQRIADWLDFAMIDDAKREIANKSLAMAGLRIRDMGPEGARPVPHLLIASPFSHPQIADWTRNHDFGGSLFLPALTALDGAYRPKVGFTFSGISSRVVAMPMTVVRL